MGENRIESTTIGSKKVASIAMVAAAVLLASCTASVESSSDEDMANYRAVSAETTAAPRRASPGVTAPLTPRPTDFRRVSLIVRDIEKSLLLYRDVFGFEINYDVEVTMSGKALPAGEPNSRARLVLVGGNDPWIGWIGLVEWLEPELDEPADYPKRLGVGDSVLVVNTDDAKKRCAMALQVPNVTMTAPARLQEYPGRNGAPPIRVMGCNIFDPDGNAIEINQILE